MNEEFHCAACDHTGPLDQHLHCENCGSDAVVSLEQAETLYERAIAS